MCVIHLDYRFIVSWGLFICLLFAATQKDKPEKQEKIEKKEPPKGMYSVFCVLHLFIRDSK